VPESSAPAADQVLDCTGLACPLPVVKTAQAIKSLAQGKFSSCSPPTQASSRTCGHGAGALVTTCSASASRLTFFHVLIRRVK